MLGTLLLLLLASVVALRYVSGGRYRPIVDGAVRWGCIVGGISFALGFCGPMVFAPDANQGPLLGIFITGPLGFLAGLVWGVIGGLRDREHPRRRDGRT
jgi:hypothetical protein